MACTSVLVKTADFGVFRPIRPFPVYQIWRKVPKGTSTHQGLTFETKIKCLGLLVFKIWPVQAYYC